MSQKKLRNLYIVEDTPAERTYLTDHMSKYPGIQVKGFFTGEACIKEIINNMALQPDLVLVDYYLDSSIGSKRDGLETLEKIKEICPAAEVVMITSVENPRIKELAKQKGALDYIVKGSESFKKLDTIIEEHFAL